jgi:hypothetical protein
MTGLCVRKRLKNVGQRVHRGSFDRACQRLSGRGTSTAGVPYSHNQYKKYYKNDENYSEAHIGWLGRRRFTKCIYRNERLIFPAPRQLNLIVLWMHQFFYVLVTGEMISNRVIKTHFLISLASTSRCVHGCWYNLLIRSF